MSGARQIDGISLATGEDVVAAAEFSRSNVLFFIRWQMTLTNRRLAGRIPNTVLGVIPLGSNTVSYPLANIAGVAARRSFSLLGFLIGAFLALAGLSALGSPSGAGGGVLLLLIGAVLLLSSVQASISVTNNAGQRIAHGIAVWDRDHAAQFVEMVNTAIAEHAHPAGGSPARPASTGPAGDDRALRRLEQLAKLRDAGVLTPAEYDAKRQEVLATL